MEMIVAILLKMRRGWTEWKTADYSEFGGNGSAPGGGFPFPDFTYSARSAAYTSGVTASIDANSNGVKFSRPTF
jgi:hypothetical protein